MPVSRRSGGQEAFVLALLPVDPGPCIGACREPAVDPRAQLRLAAKAGCEGQLIDADPVGMPELT